LRTLYLDCYSGASGDMLLGAMIELGVSPSELNRLIEQLGLDATVRAEKVRRAGFAATRVRVESSAEKQLRHLPDIERILTDANLPEPVKDGALRTFRALAAAEAEAHGIPLEKVHFHEIGAVDTIVDIVGVLYCVHRLAIQHISAGRVSLGSGTATMEHGTVPVPAPGTAHLLKGMPVAGGPVEGELCTPTGAALLRELVRAWGPIPPMVIEGVGAGAGAKDYRDHPNILRAFLGTLEPELGKEAQYVWLLETSVDDVTGEVLGHTIEQLVETGALDVQVIPAVGKKNRVSHLLRVVAHDGNVRDLELLLFRETGTLGIRRSRIARRTLPRKSIVVDTEFGTVAGKVAFLPDGETFFAPEYEACRSLAARAGVPLRRVYEAATQAYERSGRKEQSEP